MVMIFVAVKTVGLPNPDFGVFAEAMTTSSSNDQHGHVPSDYDFRQYLTAAITAAAAATAPAALSSAPA